MGPFVACRVTLSASVLFLYRYVIFCFAVIPVSLAEFARLSQKRYDVLAAIVCSCVVTYGTELQYCHVTYRSHSLKPVQSESTHQLGVAEIRTFVLRHAVNGIIDFCRAIFFNLVSLCEFELSGKILALKPCLIIFPCYDPLLFCHVAVVQRVIRLTLNVKQPSPFCIPAFCFAAGNRWRETSAVPHVVRNGGFCVGVCNESRIPFVETFSR